MTEIEALSRSHDLLMKSVGVLIDCVDRVIKAAKALEERVAALEAKEAGK